MLLKNTEGPLKSMEYFGLTRHTESMSGKIPEETIKELHKKLNEDAFFSYDNFETIAIIMS